MKKNLIVWITVIVCLALLAAICACTVALGDRPTDESDTDGSGSLIEVSGARVILTIPGIDLDIPLLSLNNPITQTTISLIVVTLLLTLIAFIATRKLGKRPGRLQVVVEKLVSMLRGLVRDTMGEHNVRFVPYIGTIFLCSIFGTLIGMTQIFRSTTADLSVTVAWALVTTGMVWYNNIKSFGFIAWLKGFTEPVVVMTPMNIVSEVANPVSMAFRHFGNVAGGSVLTALIYGALAALSSVLFGWIPGAVGSALSAIPIFQVGIPAFLSIYFDLFSGFVQAFVFSLLTMVYVGGACPPPEEILAAKEEKRAKRAAKQAKKASE